VCVCVLCVLVGLVVSPPPTSMCTHLCTPGPPLPPLPNATQPQSGLNRNTSVEDFFALVESGVVPAPDKDLLSKCVFPTQARPQPAQQSAVAFTGIGKSSAVLPSVAAGGDDAARAGAGGGGAKRTRGGEGGGRAKQAKTGPS
jgi:hypothetical protein